MRKVGMIIHGLNVNDLEWESIVWGVRPDRLGRVPKAMLLLLEEYPSVERILFGSGASESHGLKEGAYTIKYLFDNWHRLRDFNEFQDYSRLRLWRLKQRVMRLAEPELQSHNTFAELEHGIDKLYRLGCRRIVHVTESTHSSRAHAHGHEVLAKLGLVGVVDLITRSSDVIPQKVHLSQVVVFEPRADGQNAIVPNLRRIFRIPSSRRSEFNEKFDEILTDTGV